MAAIGLVGVSGPGLATPVTTAATAQTVAYECTDPSGPPVTLCEVMLNPDIHGGSKGTVLASHTTGGRRTLTYQRPDGVSWLAIRADADVVGGTNTAVFVLNYGSTCQDGWTSVGYQSWWANDGEDPTFESRHVHIDNICVPLGSTILDGPQTFTFHVQLHNQPAGSEFTRLRVTDYCSGTSCAIGNNGSGHNVFAQTTNLPQPDANGNLVAPFSVTLDLSTADAGRHEFRFGVYVTQPDGKVQLLSSRTQINVRATSPSYRTTSSYPIGTQGIGGWYEKDTDPGYVDVKVLSGFPESTGPLPTPSPVITPAPTPDPTPVITPAPSTC